MSSYSVPGVSAPASIQYTLGTDLNNGFGSPYAHAKTPNGQLEAFKTPADRSKLAVSGPDATGAATKALPPAKPAPIDTVQLSVADQVRELRQEGDGAVQIAAALHLTTKDVKNDLYVVTTWPALLSTAARNATADAVSSVQVVTSTHQVPAAV